MAEYLVRAQRTEFLQFRVVVPDDVTATGQVLQEAINDPRTKYEVDPHGSAPPTAWLPINVEKQA